MVKRIGGTRRKTRDKLRKNHRTKGKVSITKFLQIFEKGEKVLLKAEPAVQDGMYHPRFHNKAGVVAGTQGDCYKVKIKDFTKEKTLIVHPVHLTKLI